MYRGHAVLGQGTPLGCRQLALLPPPVGCLRAVEGVGSPALVVKGDGGQGCRLGGVHGQRQVDAVVAEVPAQPGAEAAPGDAGRKTGAHAQTRQADGDIGTAPPGHSHKMLRGLAQAVGPGPLARPGRSPLGRGQVDQALADHQHPRSCAWSVGVADFWLCHRL